MGNAPNCCQSRTDELDGMTKFPSLINNSSMNQRAGDEIDLYIKKDVGQMIKEDH